MDLAEFFAAACGVATGCLAFLPAFAIVPRATFATRGTLFAFIAIFVAVRTATRRCFGLEAIAAMPAHITQALGKPLVVGEVFLIVAADHAIEPLADRHARSPRGLARARTKAS